MNQNVIKKALFTLASAALIPMSASASDPTKELFLIEELPLQSRAIVYEHVLNYLKGNPGVISSMHTIGIDKKGTVYVLDKNLAGIASAGQPSCVGMEK